MVRPGRLDQLAVDLDPRAVAEVADAKVRDLVARLAERLPQGGLGPLDARQPAGVISMP